MTLILTVDDEPLYQRLVQANLAAEGFDVVTAGNGEQALEMIPAVSPDLVLLDVLMPRLDGITTCERIRAFSMVPIIMLTARGDEQDRVNGLNAGADDYIVKPFSAPELVARVKAVLRRAQKSESTDSSQFFQHYNLKIDFAKAEVTRDDKPVYLSATEYRLLIQFAHNIGSVLSPEALLIAVWGEQYKEDKEILWVSIARLRQKLEDNPHSPKHIVTKAGLGYILPPEGKV
jgi:DNA-binding response OmpR family regulator